MRDTILMNYVVLHKSRVAQFPLPLAARLIACILIFLGVICNPLECLGFQQPAREVAIAFGPTASGDHPDKLFIESLLNLGLHDLSIETCTDRQRIANGLQTDAGAQWTMLRMQSQASKIAANPAIIDAPDSISPEMELLRQMAFSNEEVPRTLWLQYKYQWCRWFVIRRLLAAYQAVPARENLREWSLTQIRTALDELEQLQLDIQKSPARATLGAKTKQAAGEWASLVNDSYLLQADVLLLRALFYPAKSTERIGTATEILSSLDKASLRISQDWSGRPNVDLARCNALIYLDRSDEALKELIALQQRLTSQGQGKPKPSNRWQYRLAALAAEASRNQGDLKQAGEWLDSVGGWTQSPELALEHFAILIASTSNSSDSQDKITESLRFKNEIGKRFGGYWQQRADAILVSNDLMAPESKNKIELLMSEAKQLLAAKQWPRAIDKLHQAEQSAASSKDASAALDIVLAIAAVLDKLDQHEDAASEMHRAAIEYRSAPKAADVALMSIWNVDPKTLFADQESAELQRSIYRGRLMDIVTNWPNSRQADSAASKLERFLLSTDQLPELVQLWNKRLTQLDTEKSTRAMDESGTTAFDALFARYCLLVIASQESWFDRTLITTDEFSKVTKGLREMGTKLAELAGVNERPAIVALIETLSKMSRWPAPDLWSQLQSASVKATSLSSNIQWLASQSASPDTDPVSTQSAALSKLNQADGLTQIILKWTRAESQFQQLLQSGLSSNMAKAQLDPFVIATQALKEAQLPSDTSFVTLLGPELEEQLNRSILSYEASILCWTGKESEGAAALAAARKKEPRNPWWTYRTARVLQTVPSQRESAIQMFRNLANGFTAGSEPWLEARARTVQTMRLLNNNDEAQKVASIVLETYSSISEEWKSRFAK